MVTDGGDDGNSCRYARKGPESLCMCLPFCSIDLLFSVSKSFLKPNCLILEEKIMLLAVMGGMSLLYGRCGVR